MEERHHLTRSGLQILLGNVNGCNVNGCNYMINKALIIIHYMHFASSMPGNAYLKHATNFVRLPEIICSLSPKLWLFRTGNIRVFVVVVFILLLFLLLIRCFFCFIVD